MNTPVIRNNNMLITPTPLPPKMQFNHIPVSGDNTATGLRLSCSQLIAPQVTSTVSAAQVAPAEVPNRNSLPSRLPRCWSTGKPAPAGIVTCLLTPGALALGTSYV